MSEGTPNVFLREEKEETWEMLTLACRGENETNRGGGVYGDANACGRYFLAWVSKVKNMERRYYWMRASLKKESLRWARVKRERIVK